MTQNENKQTIATDKWQKKKGYVSKSFKLKKDLVDEFKETCERLGISQAKQLTIMMKQFIKENS